MYLFLFFLALQFCPSLSVLSTAPYLSDAVDATVQLNEGTIVQVGGSVLIQGVDVWWNQTELDVLAGNVKPGEAISFGGGNTSLLYIATFDTTLLEGVGLFFNALAPEGSIFIIDALNFSMGSKVQFFAMQNVSITSPVNIFNASDVSIIADGQCLGLGIFSTNSSFTVFTSNPMQIFANSFEVNNYLSVNNVLALSLCNGVNGIFDIGGNGSTNGTTKITESQLAFFNASSLYFSSILVLCCIFK